MNRRNFINLLGCGCLSLGLHSCTTTPITDRKQLKLIPEHKLNAQAAQIYEQVKKKEKLSNDKAQLDEIIQIGKKMENSISTYFEDTNMPDPTSSFDWEYILIENDKVKNAWCMPGGKIAFYTGMLKITKNIDGLAIVMGHEIAHAVAKHSIERQSQATAINVGTQVADIFLGGAINRTRNTVGKNTGLDIFQLGIMNPFGRKQETEADYLGLIFSSLAGYDIRESTKIWERMSAAKKGKAPPQFLSTHPSNENRIINLKKWINEVIVEYPPIIT